MLVYQRVDETWKKELLGAFAGQLLRVTPLGMQCWESKNKNNLNGNEEEQQQQQETRINNKTQEFS